MPNDSPAERSERNLAQSAHGGVGNETGKLSSRAKGAGASFSKSRRELMHAVAMAVAHRRGVGLRHQLGPIARWLKRCSRRRQFGSVIGQLLSVDGAKRHVAPQSQRCRPPDQFGLVPARNSSGNCGSIEGTVLLAGRADCSWHSEPLFGPTSRRDSLSTKITPFLTGPSHLDGDVRRGQMEARASAAPCYRRVG